MVWAGILPVYSLCFNKLLINFVEIDKLYKLYKKLYFIIAYLRFFAIQATSRDDDIFKKIIKISTICIQKVVVKRIIIMKIETTYIQIKRW